MILDTAGTASIRTTVAGVAAVLLASSCWALSGIFVKLILVDERVTPLALAFWRDTAAFVAFLVLAVGLERSRLRIHNKDRWPLAAMGVCLGLFHVALNVGYRLNGAAITTIQQAAMPAIVLIVARIVWREPFTPLKVLSLALIGGGTVLVSGIIRIDAPQTTLAGILAGFLVPTLYAGWSLFGKALRSVYSAVVTLTWAFGIAALILMPIQLWTCGLRPPSLPAVAYLWFGGLTGLSTVFAFFAFTFALGRLPAGIASLLVMSEIAFALIFANLILDESLLPIEVMGALVVVVGVVILLAPDVKRASLPSAWRR